MELEEELEAHLEAQKNKESSEAKENEEEEEGEESDWSESPPLSDEEETEDEEEEAETERETKKEKNIVKSFKEKNSESKVMGGPRRSVSFGDVSERLFSREQDNGLLKETISEQAITSVHNGTFSQVFFQ